MRVLIVAFYFPPAGGGGVQRTLKFCKFLPDHGVDVHVLTPYEGRNLQNFRVRWTPPPPAGGK